MQATHLSAADLPRFLEPDPETGASGGVVVGDVPLAHTTQILPMDLSGDAAAQVDQALGQLDAALRKAKSGLDRCLKLNVCLARAEVMSQARQALAKRFSGERKPAVSYVVTALPRQGALIGIDAVATTDLDPGREVQFAAPAQGQGRERAQVAVIPSGGRLYISGQAEPADSLAEATRKTLESLRATLKFLGRGDADAAQLKAFLTPMADVATVEREIAAFFGDRPAPPVVYVEWISPGRLPIEIELVAWGGPAGDGEPVEYLTPPGMTASPIYSRVARIHRTPTIYVSGLYAAHSVQVDAERLEAGEREVKEVFASLERILRLAGGDFRHLVKATYYVSTDAASAKLNELRPRYYDPQRPPAASKAMVSGVGRPRLGLTIDMIAAPAR